MHLFRSFGGASRSALQITRLIANCVARGALKHLAKGRTNARFPSLLRSAYKLRQWIVMFRLSGVNVSLKRKALECTSYGSPKTGSSDLRRLRLKFECA